MQPGLPVSATAGDPFDLPGGDSAPVTPSARPYCGLSEAVVDLEAIAHNTRVLAAHARGAVMAVVKANGFGHGAVPVARAALDHGATWLGVASSAEALALREAGISAPVLSWMHVPDEDFTEALRQGIDLSAASPAHLAGISACADTTGTPALVHLKADTGLRSNGSSPDRWDRLVKEAAEFEKRGLIRVRGVWSHLIHPDDPVHPDTTAQIRAFDGAVERARAAGLRPELLHLANSAAALAAPGTHYDMVRAGTALYGIEPVRNREFGLRPAMTLRGRIIMNRRVDAQTGVGHVHDHATTESTTLALVPLGFADGLPRAASGRAEIQVGGVRRKVVGRIAMDQCVVDTGAQRVPLGEEVVVFGPGTKGEPTVAEWAEWAGTNAHEILTGIGDRVPRHCLPARPERDAVADPRLRVAVLFGGPGSEHEVSCASAAAVLSHLDREQYAVQPVRITPDGCWIPGPADLPAGAHPAEDLVRLTPDDPVCTWESLRRAMPALAAADVVLPVLNGRFDEDGRMQGLLRTVGVPYVGNGASASVICTDRGITKSVLAGGGVPVADGLLLRAPDGEAIPGLPAADRQRLGLPVVVKPARAGSGTGVTRIEAWADLEAAIAAARTSGDKVLVEEEVQGREIDVAVLEFPDGQLEAGPPLENGAGGGPAFVGSDAANQGEATRCVVPAALTTEVTAELQRLAVEVFQILGCSGLVHVHFTLREGAEPVVNEVDVFPGFSAVSPYPRIWAVAGLPYARLLDVLIQTALGTTAARRGGQVLGRAQKQPALA